MAQRFFGGCFKIFVLSTLVALFGCKSVPESIAQVTSPKRNSVQVKDFRLEVKWCSVTADRRALCEIEMVSLYQDQRAGMAYPIMQDQRGNEYRMNTGKQPAGGVMMVAGQPYRFHFETSNLPSYVSEVRSVNGTFVAWLPNGTKTAHKAVIFSGIPAHQPEAAVSAPAAAPRAAPAPATAASQTAAQTAALPPALSVSESYWHATIVPVVEMPTNQVIQLWERGAYLHLRGDGLVGYNWSKPGGYLYDAANTWSQQGDIFTIKMTVWSYPFNAGSAEDPLTTFDDQGGAFKMSMKRKARNQN